MNTAADLQAGPAPIPEWLEIVRQKVDSLRYGVVQIVVHDARVTQIERTEKTRLSSGLRATTG